MAPLPVDPGTARATDEAIPSGKNILGHEPSDGFLRPILEWRVALEAPGEEALAARQEGQPLEHFPDLGLDLGRPDQETNRAGQAGKPPVAREQRARLGASQPEEGPVVGDLEVERVIAHGAEPTSQLPQHRIEHEPARRFHG